MNGIAEMITGISEKIPIIDCYLDKTDGLMHCRRCGTPAQSRIMFRNSVMTVNCLCKCRKEAADAEEIAFRERQKADEISRNSSGMKDAKYKVMTFDKSDCSLRTAENYCNNFKKMLELNAGLMFIGNVGSGKTYAAACIGNQLICNGYTVYMDNITSICSGIQAQYDKQERIDSICSADCLIIDDIGAERSTEYMQETVYRLIDTRYRTGKPLIITSNISIEEMKASQGMLKRIYDRIFEMCCYPVTITAESRRKKIGNEKFKELRSILG